MLSDGSVLLKSNGIPNLFNIYESMERRLLEIKECWSVSSLHDARSIYRSNIVLSVLQVLPTDDPRLSPSCNAR